MIVAVISRKGGVGKTTSVVSLAGALAQLGKRVLVVDLDSQASASVSFFAAASALTAASSTQPTTSFTAAALIAITPRGVRAMSNSIMIRPRIGSAVIENRSGAGGRWRASHAA